MLKSALLMMFHPNSKVSIHSSELRPPPLNVASENQQELLVQADLETKLKNRSGSPPTKLVACPFVVNIDGALHDQFYDVRDAVAAARAAKKNKLSAMIAVTDLRTGLVIRYEG